jgi:hypothetical protein
VALFSFSISGLQLLNFFVPAPSTQSKLSSQSLAAAISRNGLAYFLVANVITGAVNMMSIPGEYISSDLPTALFLLAYSFVISLIAYFVNWRREKVD